MKDSIVPRITYTKTRRLGAFITLFFWLVLTFQVQASEKKFGLDELIRIAQNDNPAVGVARAKLRDYEALLSRAYLAWLPSLRFEAFVAPLPERRQLKECVDMQMTDENGFSRVFPCPGQNLQADERITIDTDIGLLTRGSAKVTLPIYTFGKVKHAQRAARNGVLIGELGIDFTREEIAFLVRRAYFGAQMATSALDIIKDALSRFSEARKDIRKSLDANETRFTTNDLRRLTVDEVEVKARLLETQALQTAANEALRIAASKPVGASVNLDTYTLQPLSLQDRSDEEFLELAYQSRPSIRMAQTAIAAREAQVQMARANFFPDVALVGAVEYAKGTTAEEPNDPFASDPYNFLNWGVVLGATWKLDFALLNSELKRAQATLFQQRNELDVLKQQVRLELVSKISEFRRRKAEMDIRAEAQKAAKSWLVSNTLNFGMGLSGVDPLIRSLTAFSRAKINMLLSIYEYNLSVSEVNRVVGLDLTIHSKVSPKSSN